MAGNRAGVLKSVHQVLEGSSGLRTVLGHTVGAQTVQAGARIVGDDIRLDDLPLPMVVLTFDGGEGVRQVPGMTTWAVSAYLYASNVYQAADVLDEIENLAAAYDYDETLHQPLSLFRVAGHERLEPVGSAQRLLAWRVNHEVSWLPT